VAAVQLHPMSPNLPKRRNPPKPPRRRTAADEILGPEDASLLDIVDNLLSKGVLLNGDLTIGLAQVDLIYARLSLLLSAADRVLPGEHADFMERHHARHVLRERVRGKRAGTATRLPRRRARA
jgi:hypothetical protein